MIRPILFGLTFLTLSAGIGWAQGTVRIGFRADAPPFSYEAPDGSYQGFLVDLCRSALRRAGYGIEEVLISAEDRFDQLARAAAEGGIDVLCDPTSISVRTASEFLLSPQVFATGVGYLRNIRVAGEADVATSDVKVGYLKGTTAGVAVRMANDRGDFFKRDGSVMAPQEADTHLDGVTRVCDGTYDYYFGDLDILRAVRQQVEQNGVDCQGVHDSGTTSFSYEAYALAVDADRPDIAIALQSGLFMAFSDGTAREAYDRHFQGNRRTDPLQAVFSLNNVYPCRLVQPDPCAPDPGN